jgi:hypothetical protein
MSPQISSACDALFRKLKRRRVSTTSTSSPFTKSVKLIKDLLVDLRRLKKRLDFESETDRSTAPDQRQSISGTSTSAQVGPSTASLASVHPTSSAEYIVSQIRLHKTGVMLTVVAVPLLIAASFFIWSKFATAEKPAAPAGMKITKLTSGGRVNGFPIDGSTSISPDGKYVVFTLNQDGKISMWVRTNRLLH